MDEFFYKKSLIIKGPIDMDQSCFERIREKIKINI